MIKQKANLKSVCSEIARIFSLDYDFSQFLERVLTCLDHFDTLDERVPLFCDHFGILYERVSTCFDHFDTLDERVLTYFDHFNTLHELHSLLASTSNTLPRATLFFPTLRSTLRLEISLIKQRNLPLRLLLLFRKAFAKFCYLIHGIALEIILLTQFLMIT